MSSWKQRAALSLLWVGVKKEPSVVLLGDILQEIMDAKDLGVRALARALGSSPSRISRIVSEGEEAGSLKASTLEELAKLSEELGWPEITARLKLKARMSKRETSRKGGWR